jgi:hypothetical protein
MQQTNGIAPQIHDSLQHWRYWRAPVAVDSAVSRYAPEAEHMLFDGSVHTALFTARAAALEVETCSTLRAVERGQM